MVRRRSTFLPPLRESLLACAVMSKVSAIILFAAVLISGPSRSALGAPSRMEMDARAAFGAGRYEEALDLYVKLYAEKLHPVYMRNIGRCYQNLGQPDKAISSFHEYLRKAKKLSKDEQAEINGYIAEMEALKKQQDAAATPVPEPAPEPVPQTVHTPPPAPSVATLAAPAAAPTETSESTFAKPWFWGVVGAVVVIGVLGGLAAGGVFSSEKDAQCPAGRICP